MGRKTRSDKYIVYKHTNLQNGKVYIGITSTTIEQRSGRGGRNYIKNKHFYAAIQKYGWDKFAHEALYTDIELGKAAELEQQLIAKFKANDPAHGYNLSSGGEGGNTGVKLSDEVRIRKSLAMSGDRNPWYGKFGEAHPAYGRKKTEAELAICRNSNKGKKRSEHTKKLISDLKIANGSWSGKDNPMYGKRYELAPQAKEVICLETSVIYPCIKRAAEENGLLATCITACCKGKHHTCGGFHWAYYEGSENHGTKNEAK